MNTTPKPKSKSYEEYANELETIFKGMDLKSIDREKLLKIINIVFYGEEYNSIDDKLFAINELKKYPDLYNKLNEINMQIAKINPDANISFFFDDKYKPIMEVLQKYLIEELPSGASGNNSTSASAKNQKKSLSSLLKGFFSRKQIKGGRRRKTHKSKKTKKSKKSRK